MHSSNSKIGQIFSEHVRLSMQSTNSGGQAAGFITVTSWSAEGEKVSSTNSSPSHTAQINEDRSPVADQGHRRCQSLPAAVNHRLTILFQHANLIYLCF